MSPPPHFPASALCIVHPFTIARGRDRASPSGWLGRMGRARIPKSGCANCGNSAVAQRWGSASPDPKRGSGGNVGNLQHRRQQYRELATMYTAMSGVTDGVVPRRSAPRRRTRRTLAPCRVSYSMPQRCFLRRSRSSVRMQDRRQAKHKRLTVVSFTPRTGAEHPAMCRRR